MFKIKTGKMRFNFNTILVIIIIMVQTRSKQQHQRYLLADNIELEVAETRHTDTRNLVHYTSPKATTSVLAKSGNVKSTEQTIFATAPVKELRISDIRSPSGNTGRVQPPFVQSTSSQQVESVETTKPASIEDITQRMDEKSAKRDDVIFCRN